MRTDRFDTGILRKRDVNGSYPRHDSVKMFLKNNIFLLNEPRFALKRIVF